MRTKASESQPERERERDTLLPEVLFQLLEGLCPSELLHPTRASCLLPPTMIANTAPLKSLHSFHRGPSTSSSYKNQAGIKTNKYPNQLRKSYLLPAS